VQAAKREAAADCVCGDADRNIVWVIGAITVNCRRREKNCHPIAEIDFVNIFQINNF
jgi:hypothetical protein